MTIRCRRSTPGIRAHSTLIIQGVSQYGVRGGTKRGGFGGVQLENLYEEIGGCSNPAGAIGQAGVIAQGSRVMINGGEAPGGSAPTFVNTGTTDYRYYIVAHNGTYGDFESFVCGPGVDQWDRKYSRNYGRYCRREYIRPVTSARSNDEFGAGTLWCG